MTPPPCFPLALFISISNLYPFLKKKVEEFIPSLDNIQYWPLITIHHVIVI